MATGSDPVKSKVFHDPIHGHMEFDDILVKIIDTPQFQRLRNIKQMGGAYFVYPGASHTRFEHSLGVAYLAGQLVRSLQRKQPELKISDRDVRCVEIAGLCHDLGHGPFSHMFDGEFIPKAAQRQSGLESQSKKTWEHEEASVRMFHYIVKELKELKSLKKDNEGNDLDFIKEMINGPNKQGQYNGRPREKAFLYEIVANKRNNIDVDKMDYFARDFYHLGIKSDFDYRRFIKFARVCEVDGELQICVRDKELENMYEVFHTRACIHRKVCQHKTIKIIQFMITEALLKADSHLKLYDKVKSFHESSYRGDENCPDDESQQNFSGLTDSIIEEILFSTEPQLKDAKEILKNVFSRKLYKFLGRIRMRDDDARKIKSSTDKEKQIEDWKDELAKMRTYQNEKPLKKEDFEILIMDLNFGMKDKNPVERLRFYSKFNEKKAFQIPNEQVSQLLLPPIFSEKWINVYCRETDGKRQTVAYKMFSQWCHQKNFSIPQNLPVDFPPMPQPKIFNDPIHGCMEFHPDLVRIIDSPQCQRLRFLKRLGAASYVYPGASHNHFEHCLGVAHLAGEFVRSLMEKQPDFGIDEKDVLVVETAGLCHGLALGPLCQEFPNILKKDVQEKTSAEIFKEIVKDKELTVLSKDDIERVCKILNGEKDNHPKSFLFDIVKNQTTGVDVCVFDSVVRDCYQLGLKTNFHHQRLIKFARVKNNEIQFRDKVWSTVKDLVHTQNALRKKAYEHQVTMKIQQMMRNDIEKKLNTGTKVDFEQLTDAFFMGRTPDQINKNENPRCLYKDLMKSTMKRPAAQEDFTREVKKRKTGELQVEEGKFGQVCTIEVVKDKVKYYGKNGETLTAMEVEQKFQNRPDSTSPPDGEGGPGSTAPPGGERGPDTE